MSDSNCIPATRSCCRDPQTWLLAALTLAAALSLVLCLARCLALPTDLRLFSTSGEEGVVIYTVWKAAHGYPIYQIPAAGLYDSAIYNLLFYEGYGRLCSWLGADGDRLVASARLITCLSGLIGAWAQWRVLGLLVSGPVRPRERWLMAAMVALTWFGSSFLNWWLVSVRPDVPATAMAMLGLWLALLGLRRRSAWLMALAAVPFYAAWALKQSLLWMLSGAVLAGMLSRPTRRVALVLAGIIGVAFALTVFLGGEAYRYQTLYLSSINRIVPWDSFNRSQQLLPPLLLIWIFALLPAVLRLRQRTRALLPAVDAPQAESIRVVACGCLIAVGLGIVAIGKEGSGRNHLLEGMVLASTLATVTLVRVMRMSASGARTGLLVGATVLGALLCGRPCHSLFLDSSGITRGSPADQAQHRLLEQVLAGAPKPAFVDDEILCQPWHANDNRYPGLAPDFLMYAIEQRHGLVTDGGLAYLVTHGMVNALLVVATPLMTSELLEPARAAGFTARPLPDQLAAVGWVLLVRPTR